MDCVIKPCDWETIYLATESDPNKFGEALRDYCFIGNCMETGCYSTFELLKGFEEIKSGKIYEEAFQEIAPEFKEGLKVYKYEILEKDCYLETTDMDGEIYRSKICEPLILIVAWEWNGDGTLYFRWNNRSVINTDCKCDYYWNWINKGG